MSINEDFWENIYKIRDWNIYNNPKPALVYVTCFDDGNDKYKIYKNKWNIFGEWREKVALVNAENNIKIPSISLHKIRYYDDCHHEWKDGSEQGIDEHRERYCNICGLNI